MSENGLNSQELRRYWGVILRRKYLALSIALGVLSVCTIAAFVLPQVYEANSTVFIQRSTMTDPIIQGTPGISNSLEERLRTVQDRITSRHIIERVVKTLNPNANTKDPQKLEALITGIQKSIKVTVKSSEGRGSADLFAISYEGENPQQVKDFVNTLTSVFVEENTSFSRSEAYNAFEFIQKQVGEYKAKLEESDAALIAFRVKYPRVPVMFRESVSTPVTLAPSISPEQARLTELNRQLTTLLSKYTENHPEVVKTRAEIAEVKREAALSSVARNAASATRRTPATVTRRSPAPAPETAGLPAGLSSKAQEEWMKLQHDRSVQQKIYDDLVQKLENARVAKDLEFTKKASAFRVTDPAILPYTPIKPDRVRFILVGIFLGIAAGIGAVFGIEHLRHSFTDEDSIEKSLGVPVLVTIPTVNNAAENLAARRLDIKVLIAASAYLSIIILILIREVMVKYLGMTLSF